MAKAINPLLSIFGAIIKVLKENVQTNQTAIVSVVLSISVLHYWLYIDLSKILVTLTTILVTEIFMQIRLYWGKSLRFSWAFNALWWISFFLRTDELLIYVLAGMLAILWKYVFTTKEWRHFMNPSNMAASICLISFPIVAWTNPLQFGFYSDIYKTVFIYTAIFILGSFILWRTYKLLRTPVWITTLVFFVVQLFIFTFFTKEWTMHQYLTYFNPGYFIFIFFMITDPKTSPLTRMGWVFHWAGIAILFFVLQYYINESYSNLIALFLMTWTLPFVWKLEQIKWRYNLSKWNLIQIALILIFISIFAYNVSQSWVPDLLFDNRCGQLFCS